MTRREREVEVMAALEVVFSHLLAASGEPPAPPKAKPAVGRIVLYKLTLEDARWVTQRRIADGTWPAGAQGREGLVGDVLPMVVIRVWPDELAPGFRVSGQVLLDGDDQLWIAAAKEGGDQGEWRYG